MVNLSFERKRKLQIYLLAALMILCCLMLVACNKDYSTNVEGPTVQEPSHFMAKFMIKINDSLGGGTQSFGWTVIIFTIILRLILSPLDIWQKVIGRKNSKAMERMKPELETLQARYADDPQRLQQEQAALYKREKYSMMGMCLPTIVSFVVFFVVFAGFREMVGYQFGQDYKNCYNAYETAFSAQVEEKYGDVNGDGKFDINDVPRDTAEGANFVFDANVVAQQAVYDDYYSEERTKVRSWLWIKNIFVGDNWSEAVPGFTTVTGQKGFATSRLKGIDAEEYNRVMGAVLGTGGWNKKSGKWNGLLILPVLSIVLSFLSTKLLSSAQGQPPKPANKQGEKEMAAQSSMKAMQWIMPIMMGVFGLLYSGAFALYMFTSSLVAILFQLAFNLIGRIIDKRKGATVKK